MKSEFTYKENNKKSRNESSTANKLNENNQKGKPIEGKITGLIGAGENAKYSLAFITLSFGFGLGALITFGLYIKFVSKDNCYTSFIEDTKLIWAIFIPLITLALGYAFGKEK